MDIIDTIYAPGKAEKPNEDALGNHGQMAWVLDGATGLVEEALIAGEGQTDASWLSGQLNQFLQNIVIEPSSFKWEPMMEAASEFIQESFAKDARRPVENSIEEPFTAMQAVYDHGQGRISTCGISDCVLLIETKDGLKGCYGHDVHHRIDEESTALAKTFFDQGMGFDEVRPLILDKIREGRAMANREDGYWVFGVRPGFLPHLEIEEFDVEEGAHGLIMSDGLYRLVEMFGRYDDASLMEAAKTKGLQALYDELREIETTDNMGHQYARLKQFDDVSAQLLRF